MPVQCFPQLQGVPEAEARHFFQQLIVALAYTHRVGIANRDIKVRQRRACCSSCSCVITRSSLCRKAINGQISPCTSRHAALQVGCQAFETLQHLHRDCCGIYCSGHGGMRAGYRPFLGQCSR